MKIPRFWLTVVAIVGLSPKVSAQLTAITLEMEPNVHAWGPGRASHQRIQLWSRD